MLVESNYIKYDMTLQEYYINKDCVINYTSYNDDKLGALGIDDIVIKNICHSVYRLMYNHYRGLDKFTHKKYIRKKIYDNNYEEVQVLQLAMIEAVKGAIESGMDFNAYIDEPKENLPYTVTEELKSANLLDRTQKLDRDLDITYTSGDETIAT